MPTRRFSTLIGLLILTCSLSAADGAAIQPDSLQIYLCIGQSNMAGRATITDSIAGPIERCWLLDRDGKWVTAANPLNIHSTIRKGADMQKLGPSYQFAVSTLEAQPTIQLGLVVNAKGGSNINEWAKGTTFYQEAIRRSQQAMASGTLAGIIWHQGESNAKDEAYLAKITQLIADLRSDLGAPDLPFVAGQIYYNGETKAHTKGFNERLLTLPKQVAHTAVVSTDGLSTQDNTHFNTQSALELGKRYAAAMAELTKQSK